MKFYGFWKFSRIILFGLSIISSTFAEFLAEMFVNDCVKETQVISALVGDNPASKYPLVIISMCHAVPVSGKFSNYKEQTEVKQIAHHSSHSIRIHFSRITQQEHTTIFQNIYERLLITSIQLETFQRNAQTYAVDYPHYDMNEFKLEFLHSRWNIDEIFCYKEDSAAAYKFFIFGNREKHLPYSMERIYNRHKNISNLFGFYLYYRVISGRGHKCKHENRLEKLRELTLNFNAYDRIFCDAFDYYNLPFQGYWSEWDMVYHRARLVRDDIVSHFPPEASQVLYYASPWITFVVLQREPVTWMFMLRPFPASLWGFIVLALLILKGIQRLARIEGHNISIVEMQRRYCNAIVFTTELYRTVVVSAYCGMALLGILYPLYTWTPDTFADLNSTSNYLVCTSYDAPIKDTHLKENFELNGVPEENWIIRNLSTPALYFDPDCKDYKLGKETDAEGDGNRKQYFRAALMYDDKMNLWMKGREFLRYTYSIFNKIKPAHDKVLSEMRYISIASGATRLHFLMDAIKWGFTCGVWLRYYKLEMNYYKNVAPLIVARMKREEKANVKRNHFGDQVEDNKRPLTWNDLYSCFVVAVVGLAIAGVVLALENVHEGCIEITKADF